MRKALIILSLLAISSLATTSYYQEASPLWGTWKNAHKKEYSAAEDSARLSIFVDNYKKIVKHNAEHANPRMGLGKFADLTSEEFKSIYTGGLQTGNKDQTARKTVHYGLIKAPDSVDWRDEGVVNPVKSQDSCGSCWAFATVGALESFYAINQGQLLSFSEQQLVDCDTDSFGCQGGWPSYAFDYAGSNGIASEDEYPYQNTQGQCQYQGGGTQANTGHADVPKNSVDDLKSAIATAPTTVLVEVNDMFQHYSGGIIGPDQECGVTLNHAVLAVGYGDVDGQGDAFFIRNSWGDRWGDQGYVYISTDASANDGAGVCGVLAYAVAPQ